MSNGGATTAPIGPRLWTPNFKVVETLTSIGAGATVKILDANPDRVAVIFSQLISGSNITLSTTSKTGGSQGIVVAQNLPLILSFALHGGLVQSQWFAFIAGAGGNITTIESIWLSTGG